MNLSKKELQIINECLDSLTETLLEEITSAEDDVENPYDYETKEMIRKYIDAKRKKLFCTYKIMVKVQTEIHK